MSVETDLQNAAAKIRRVAALLDSAAGILRETADSLVSPAVGIAVVPGTPIERRATMASKGCTLVKRSPGTKAALKLKRGDPEPVAFQLQDNQDCTYTLFGVNASGAQLDISDIATHTVVSDDTTIVSVDPPVGMTGKEHALKVGSTSLHLTATWNDGSIGPFTIDWPQEVKQDPVATGLVIVPGTPTVR